MSAIETLVFAGSLSGLPAVPKELSGVKEPQVTVGGSFPC